VPVRRHEINKLKLFRIKPMNRLTPYCGNHRAGLNIQNSIYGVIFALFLCGASIRIGLAILLFAISSPCY